MLIRSIEKYIVYNYKIACECGKVNISGRCTHEWIKEKDKDIRLSWTQKTLAVSEHANKTRCYPLWDEVKFIDQDHHWYSRQVKEAIHIRLHPKNINRDSGIEIPEAWMATVRQHDNLSPPQQTTEGSVSSSHNANNTLDGNSPTKSEVCDTPKAVL